MVQTLAEEGALVGEHGHYRLEQAPTELHISPTVQGVLAARIDRLTAEEKKLLQQLSVIGRQFPVSLIKQVVTQPEAELYRILSALQAKEFLYEQSAFPEVECLFKHALTQEVAYGTVLQDTRKALHEQTARVMETLHKDSLEDHYGELAHHYSRSANPQKAVEYLSLAGQQAMRQLANSEATAYLTTAVEFLHTLPDTPERGRQELLLQVSLGTLRQAAQGFTAPEVEQTYQRALTLCRQVGDTPHLFDTLLGLWMFYSSRAELQTARELGEQLLTLAQQAQDSGLLSEASYTLGTALYGLGEFVSAHFHLEQGLADYAPQQHRSLAILSGQDPGVACGSMSAMVLWELGYPDQARKRNHEALMLAHELAHPGLSLVHRRL